MAGMTETSRPHGDEPDAPSAFRRRMAAIMAADVAGYSRLLAADEEGALKLFHECRDIFDAEVARYGGRIFNTAGDSVMSEFASAVEAVRAAIAIQHALDSVNAPYPEDRRVQFRIGVTIGDVIERGDDLLGDGVNVAARLEAAARPGGICVSRIVHDAVAGKVSAAFQSIGPQSLKNIPTPVEAFTVTLAASGAPPSRTDHRSGRNPGSRGGGDENRAARRKRRLTRIALIVLAFTIVIPTLRYTKRLLETQMGLKLATPSGPATTMRPPKGAGGNATPAGLSSAGLSPDRSDAAKNFYQKGRTFEAAGDLPAAQSAYIDAARAGASFVDPLLRLAALVRLRDGAAAARDLFADLSTITPDSSIRMIAAQQLPQAEQAARLKRILNEDPSFTPAWYALAVAIGDGRAGRPTLTRLRTELAALDEFLAAYKNGALARFFIDASVLKEWAGRATRRTGEIDAAFAHQQTRPTLSYQPGHAHWTVNIALPEDTTGVQYRLGDKGGFSRADLNEAGDGRTASFAFPGKTGKTNIYVTYTDVAGLTAGPFAFRFDTAELNGNRQRSVLLATSGSWLTWATDRDELYFSYLLNYRCAIRSAHVGFDGAEPDIALPLPASGCETEGAPPPPGAQNSMPAPHDARSVSVRLTLVNGETTPAITIPREQ